MSTYSSNLGTNLITTGDQSGTWGITTNFNLGTLMEQAISSYCTQQFNNANITLTLVDGADAGSNTTPGTIYTAGTTTTPISARNMYIECQGTSSGNTLYVPLRRKLYFIYNNITSGGGDITVAPVTGAGTSVAVKVGQRALLVCDGTNIVNAINIVPNTVTSVTATSPVASTGGTTPVISMPAATTSVSGYLTSTDWNTFNNKQPAGTYVNSVTGTAPIVSSGGTTPAISMPAATTSVSGYLTSTDWNTFNNKQAALVSGTNIKTVNSTSLLGSGDVSVGVTSVTGTAPIVSSGGATPAISMPAATTSTNGYLTSTDWNTFNSKQAAGSYLTTVTADAPLTGSGTSGSHLSMPAATTSVSGYLTSTDWNTFNGKQAALVSGTNIKTVNGTSLLGSGDVGVGVTSVTATSPVASTGGTTPVISMPAATTSTSGYLTSTDWNTFNNKGSGTVTSVTATSPVASTGGTTPVISMPAATTSVSGYLTSTDWNTFNNKQPAGSYLTSVTADSPLTGSGTSGSHLSMPAATASTNGYLTSTDWNTFNSKGSGTITGSGSSSYIPKFSSTTAIGSSSIYDNTNGVTGTRIGIGTALPAYPLQVATSIGDGVVSAESSAFGADAGFRTVNALGDHAHYLVGGGGAYLGSVTSIPLYIRTNSTIRMKFDAAGNIGVGTTSPASPFHIAPGVTTTNIGTISGSSLFLEAPVSTPGQAFITFGNSVSNTYTYGAACISYGVTNAAGGGYGSIIFSTRNVTTDTAPTNTMRLDPNGYLLCGYNSSNGAYRLQVNSQIYATSATIATSDGNYKENINPLENALDLVCALNPVSFDWKEHPVHNFDRSTTTTGFIAQEVQTALQNTPYVNAIIKSNTCVLEPEERDTDGNITKPAVTEEFLGIAEGNLIAVLTKAVQELKAELDTVKAELQLLKGG